jgi:hypothetical protein
MAITKPDVEKPVKYSCRKKNFFKSAFGFYIRRLTEGEHFEPNQLFKFNKAGILTQKSLIRNQWFKTLSPYHSQWN